MGNVDDDRDEAKQIGFLLCVKCPGITCRPHEILLYK